MDTAVIRKMKWVGKMITKGTIWLRIIAVVAASIISVLYHYNKIDTAQTLEIAALTTLVLITAYYAKQTATMAKEMREQRYDAVRPVIDIQRHLGERLREGLAAQSGELSYGLWCTLRNIGVGPAIDVYSYIQTDDGRRLCPFGTLPIREATPEKRLSLEQTGNRMVLVAYYKDVYGRDIESRREVSIAQVSGGWKVDPLEIEVRKATKEKPTK